MPNEFQISSNLRFLASQWRHGTLIKMKFGMEEYAIGLVLRAKSTVIGESEARVRKPPKSIALYRLS